MGNGVVGLEHVQVAAPQNAEPEARRFYGELLGLTEISKPETLRASGGVWFAAGSGELHVGIEESFAPARKAHPGLEVTVEALEELAQRLVASGAPVAWDERYPGRRRFYTDDPWGNRLELFAREQPA